MKDKIETPAYPLTVVYNGRNVGVMERNGTVTFSDNNVAMEVMNIIQSTDMGLATKDNKTVQLTSLGAKKRKKTKQLINNVNSTPIKLNRPL